MSKGLLLVGGGGHCRSVLDSVLAAAEFSNVAIVDLPENVGRTVFGVPVVGDDDDLPSLFHSGYTNAVVTIGSIGNVERRVALFDRLPRYWFLPANHHRPVSSCKFSRQFGGRCVCG